MQEKTIFSYVNVKGDYLRNSNDNTKKIWDEHLLNEKYSFISKKYSKISKLFKNQ